MRVTGISSNQAYKKSASFGTIKGLNARKVLKENGIRRFPNGKHWDLTIADIESYKLIKKCGFATVYTDKADGKVKAKFTPEILDYPITLDEKLKDRISDDDFQDLSQYSEIQKLADIIDLMNLCIESDKIYDEPPPPWDEDRIINSQYYV